MNSLSSIVSILSLLLCSLRAFATEPPVTSVAFAPDGKSVDACSQAGLTIYSWPELQPQRKFETSISNLHDIAFSPSGNRLAVAGG